MSDEYCVSNANCVTTARIAVMDRYLYQRERENEELAALEARRQPRVPTSGRP